MFFYDNFRTDSLIWISFFYAELQDKLNENNFPLFINP